MMSNNFEELKLQVASEKLHLTLRHLGGQARKGSRKGAKHPRGLMRRPGTYALIIR